MKSPCDRLIKTACLVTLVGLIAALPVRFVGAATGDAMQHPLEMPTSEDRALLASFDALVQTVDKPASPVRELINNTRLPWIVPLTRQLGSMQPVDAKSLAEARSYVQGKMAELQAARYMQVPALASIPRRRHPLKIDGVLDERDWLHARSYPIVYDNFHKVTGSVAAVRLLWDEHYLYAGFTVPDSSIIAPPIERDGSVWSYDCVEMFLLPDPRSGVFWELNISPTGSVLDNLAYKYQAQWGDDDRMSETMHGLQYASTIRGTANNVGGASGYTTEIAIPIDQLPGMSRGARAGDRLNLMLCQVNRDSAAPDAPATYLAQAPYVAWLHNIWCYQPFVLSGR